MLDKGADASAAKQGDTPLLAACRWAGQPLL